MTWRGEETVAIHRTPSRQRQEMFSCRWPCGPKSQALGLGFYPSATTHWLVDWRQGAYFPCVSASSCVKWVQDDSSHQMTATEGCKTLELAGLGMDMRHMESVDAPLAR